MKSIKNKKMIFRYPITIIALSIMALFIATELIWFGFYSSEDEENTYKTNELRKKISLIDHKLLDQKKIFKKLKLANFNIFYANEITTQNTTRINILNDIIKLSKISHGGFSLTSSNNDKITIELKTKNTAKLYELIKTIESQKYIDRLTLIKNNEKQILTIYTRHLKKD